MCSDVPNQIDDIRRHVALKAENRIDTTLAVGASVDVVAQKHDAVTIAHGTPNLVENVIESRNVAVDVADGDSCHVDRASVTATFQRRERTLLCPAVGI